MKNKIFTLEPIHPDLLEIIKSDNITEYQKFVFHGHLEKIMIESLGEVLKYRCRKILDHLISKSFIIEEIKLKMGSADSYILTAVKNENLYAIQMLLTDNSIMASLTKNLKNIKKENLDLLIDFLWENQCWYFLKGFMASDFFWKKHKTALLLKAAKSDDIECLGSFFASDRVSQYWPHGYSDALIRGMIEEAIQSSNNVHFFYNLFSNPSFKKKASIRNNEFLMVAAMSENLAAINILLSIPSVIKEEIKKRSVFLKCIVSEKRDSLLFFLENNEILIKEGNDFLGLMTAIKKQDLEAMTIILNVSYLNGRLGLDKSKVFREALKGGNIAIIEKLLSFSSVVQSLVWYNTDVISQVYRSGNLPLIRAFLKIPQLNSRKDKYAVDLIKSNVPEVVAEVLGSATVVKLIESNLKAMLFVFYDLNEEVQWMLANKLTVYGLPLSMALSRDRNMLNDLKKLMKDPDRYVKRFDWSAEQYLAYHLLKSKWMLDKKINGDKILSGDFFAQDNIENSLVIGKVKKYFDTIIKPTLKVRFDSYGATDSERLDAIELEIRKTIFFKIKSNLIDLYGDSDSFLKKLPSSETHVNDLCSGKNKRAMDWVRNYFCSNEDDAQIAWRLYDPWAPVSGAWPNLLTVPPEGQVVPLDNIYTVKELSGNIQILEAVFMCRTVWAYMHLLIKDAKNVEQKELWMNVFICQLAAVRRANSTGSMYRDSPSCLPDTVSRIKPVIELHPLGAGLKNVLEVAADFIAPVVIRVFSETLEQLSALSDKQNFMSSIFMLNEQSALEMLKGPYSWDAIDGSEVRHSFNADMIASRLRFIQKIWESGALLRTINSQLRAQKLKEISEADIFGFLYNAGGDWIRANLMTIYQRHMGLISVPRAHVVVNPYNLREDIRKQFSEKRQGAYNRLKRIWSRTFYLLQEDLPEMPMEVLEEEASEISGLYEDCETDQPLEQAQALLFSYGVREEAAYHFVRTLERQEPPVLEV